MTATLHLREAGMTWREMDGELVALDAERATYFTANCAGTLLWQLLSAGTSREALVAALQESYGVADDVARRDVDAFVESLRDRGLLAA